jgi:hypothetical protein
MTAPSSIDPTRFLHEQLGSASPDLLRSMLTTFMRVQLAVPSAVADSVAELAAGRAVGVVHPPSCPERGYGQVRGHPSDQKPCPVRVRRCVGG